MSHPHYGESQKERLARKARDAPFMIAGIVGMLGMVGYGIYGLRSRKLKMSVYLIHMRMAAQGTVVLCLTAGVGYNLYQRFLQPKPPAEHKEE